MGREISSHASLFRITGVRAAGVVILAGVALAGCTPLPNGTQSQAALQQPSGVMNVADAAISGGDPAMALKVSQSALASNPQDLDALYHEGAAYYAMDRCMDAMAVYKVALGIDAQSAEAQVGIGRCLLKRNAPQAEQAFTAAVQDDPNNAAALNDLGVARDLQGNHAGAVNPYQKALLLKPGEISTEVNIGMSLALSGNGDDALQYLGPLATSQDATPKIRQDYAAALVAAGRETEARQVLAVDLPPDAVNQLLADFSAAIAAGTPQVTASAAATNPVAVPAVQTAPIQAVPLASATPVAATPAPLVPAVSTQTASAQPAPMPAAPAQAEPMVTPTVITAAAAPPAPIAMAPADLPSASLAAPPAITPPAPPAITPPAPPVVAPPPGASADPTGIDAAAIDKVVR
jgi:Flp pilus assembly protein TadD